MENNDTLNVVEEPENRSAFVAFILSVLSPGLGFLYAGKGLMAILSPLIIIIALTIFTWTRIIFTPAGFWFAFTCLFSIAILLMVYSAKQASRVSEIPVVWYQRWYVYILFILVIQIGLSPLLDLRGKLFGYETHRITSNSMSPTLLRGDYILGNYWEFDAKAPKTGDIVTFDIQMQLSQRYIMRVIGEPKDKVEIINGLVFINSIKLEEPYVNLENSTYRSPRGDFSIIVPDDHYFVLGDNRNNSRDSRSFGPVSIDNIKSRLSHIWFSYGEEGVRFERISKK